jgi:hypothetical protein
MSDQLGLTSSDFASWRYVLGDCKPRSRKCRRKDIAEPKPERSATAAKLSSQRQHFALQGDQGLSRLLIEYPVRGIFEPDEFF